MALRYALFSVTLFPSIYVCLCPQIFAAAAYVYATLGRRNTDSSQRSVWVSLVLCLPIIIHPLAVKISSTSEYEM